MWPSCICRMRRRVVHHLGASLLVLGVRDQRARAGAALHDHLEAVVSARELARDLGHERHSALALRRLFGDSDPHAGRAA